MSALAIVLAALTRATMFYWIVLLCCVFAYQAWRGRPDVRHRARYALAAYAAALALPLAFIVKNTIIFGFPFYATGGGNALYLGNNPLTGGYDAPLLGLLFDVGSIARDQSHLTLEAERLLGGVARFMIRDLDAGFLLSLHAKKLAAFLFVTGAEPGASTLRAWRIALMALATFGAVAIEHRAMRWTLLGMLLYQIGIHIPVLYTHRYSVGAIDLWLIILSAAGTASLLSKAKARSAVLALLVVLAGIQFGRWVSKITDPPQPNVFSAARIPMWDASPMDYTAGPEAAPLDVAVSSRSMPFDKSMNYVLVVDLGARGADIDAACSPLHIAFRPAGESGFSPPFERKVHDRGGQHIEVGRQRLHLYSEGTLRLAMKCPARTPVRIARLAIYAPVGSIDFRERYLHEKPLLPMMER